MLHPENGDSISNPTTPAMSGTSTPRSKLDNLSKEDLIRFLKKQLTHLAETKRELVNQRTTAQTEKREIEERNTTERKKLQSKIDQLNEKCNEQTKRLEKENNDWQVEMLDKDQKLASALEEGQLLRDCLNNRASGEEDRKKEIERLKEELIAMKTRSGDAQTIPGTIDVQSVPGAVDVQKIPGTIEVSDQRIHYLEMELSNRVELLEQVRGELEALKGLHREQNAVLEQLSALDAVRRSEIDQLKSELEDRVQELNAIKERRSVATVINLEMADYERSMHRLQTELKTANELADSRAAEIAARDAERRNLAEERAKLEGGSNKLKAAVVKLKKDLESKRQECDSLSIRLAESNTQKAEMEIRWETQKMEMATSLSNEQHRIGQLEVTVASLDRQLGTVRAQRETIQHQYDDLFIDYNNFKERAHTVLKQQQKSYGDGEHQDQQKALQKTITDLQTTLDNATLGYRGAQDELIAMREHAETMAMQVDRLKNELVEKSAYFEKSLVDQRNRWESRLAVETALSVQLRSQLEQLGLSHERERSRLTNEHRKESALLNEQMNELKKQLQMMENNRDSMISSPEPRPKIPMNENRSNRIRKIQLPGEAESSGHQHQHQHQQQQQQQHPLRASSDVEIRSETNEEQWPGLDELIRNDNEDNTNSLNGSRCQSVDEDWQMRAELATRRMIHATELLNETEASNARLHEQIKLLKEEIRRLERNSEREQHIAHCEYLKNVVLKFLAPSKVNDERPQLIPILTTMLRLGKDEVDLLNKVAFDGASSPTSPGWGGYFHRWSGLS